MRGGKNARGDPAAGFERNLEREITHAAIGDERLGSHHRPVHDNLDGHFSTSPEPGPLEIPIRRGIVGRASNQLVRDGLEICRRLDGDLHAPRAIEPQFALVGARLDAVHREVHQMALPIRDVVAAGFHRIDPFSIRQATVDLRIRARQANLVISDTGEIRLAADPRPEAGIQRVIPDVQLPDVRCIPGRNEIDRVGMRHVDDELVGADAVERRYFVVRQRAAARLQPPSGMGESNHGSLRLGPAKNGQRPGRPVLETPRARVVLILQTEEHEVTGMA